MDQGREILSEGHGKVEVNVKPQGGGELLGSW